MADDLELGSQLREVVFLAEEAGIAVEAVTRRELERQSHTKKHQGVIAVVPDPRYATVEEGRLAWSGEGYREVLREVGLAVREALERYPA